MQIDPADPWADDLFDRKQDASDLIHYLQSVYVAGAFSGEQRSQVIAVDAEYGIGKTFFLRRLASQIATDAPVAYLDTWADDFVGEPIISLAATLKSAIHPYLDHEEVSEKWRDFAHKTGRIAWIGTKGLGKQALKLLISGGAVEGIEAVWDGSDENQTDRIQDAVGETLDGIFDNARPSATDADPKQFLDEKIERYERAKNSIDELRLSLSGLAIAASNRGKSLPVFIIVDELDRCRPDYAIKFLEEVKHLFNVPEVYFIIGMNAAQLSNSISHQYGERFDGARYLDRFIDRTFHLKFPGMEKLTESLYGEVVAGEKKQLWFPSIGEDNSRRNITHTQWLAMLLAYYRIPPRGVFRFFDRLRTALALITYRAVPMNYLCELIAREISDHRSEIGPAWRFFVPGGMGSSGEWLEGAQLFNEMYGAYSLPRREMQQRLQTDNYVTQLIWEFVGNDSTEGAESYIRVLPRLARFVDLGGLDDDQ